MSLLDTRHKKKSFTLTTLLLSVLLLLMFYIGLTYLDPPIENGITVNFGTMEFGMGKEQPKERVQSQPAVKEEVVEDVVPEEAAAPPEEVASEEVTEKPAEKLLTREEEEAIKIRQQKEAEPKGSSC